MDGKLEKGEAVTQKESAPEGQTPSDDNADPSKLAPEEDVDDTEIRELSPDEVSALISAAPTDENDTRQEDIAKKEHIEQEQSQDEVIGNIDSPTNRPTEGDSAPSEHHRSAIESADPTIEFTGKDTSLDIEPKTGSGDANTRVNPDNSETFSEEKPSSELAVPRKPDTEVVMTGDHDIETSETAGNDDTNEMEGEENPDEANNRDCETDGSDGLDCEFHSNQIKTLGAIVVGCLILVGIFGFVFYQYDRPPPSSNLDGTSAVSLPKVSPEELNQISATPAVELIPSETPQNRLLEIPDQLNKIRNEMLTRAGILTDLQDQYRTGIHRIEEEIIAEVRQQKIPSLQQALNEKKIEFQLHTIQRRQAYIDHLEKPVRWLNKGSEELLFLQRKYDIESMVMPVCRDISTERLIVENDASMRRYAPIVLQAQLKADLKSTSYLSLSQVWHHIVQKKQKITVSQAMSTQKNHAGALNGYEQLATNQAIWNEICTGYFDRKCDLTALSDQAASCLAGWSESDLFINRVNLLTPGAARNLSKWKGKWLGLNGLVELPPDSASYLFTWGGGWISLNGVMFLAAESSAHLVKWKGKTLEMMGLSSELMARDPLALKHLSAWQKKGNNLFVTDEIRQLIESEG